MFRYLCVYVLDTSARLTLRELAVISDVVKLEPRLGLTDVAALQVLLLLRSVLDHEVGNDGWVVIRNRLD